jgi:hypothetical protein
MPAAALPESGLPSQAAMPGKVETAPQTVWATMTVALQMRRVMMAQPWPQVAMEAGSTVLWKPAQAAVADSEMTRERE